MLLEECKYVVKEKKMAEYITNDIEIFSHSDRKRFDEETSNEKNFDEEYFDEEN